MTGGRSQCECVALRLDAVYLVLMHRQAITSSESCLGLCTNVYMSESGVNYPCAAKEDAFFQDSG